MADIFDTLGDTGVGTAVAPTKDIFDQVSGGDIFDEVSTSSDSRPLTEHQPENGYVKELKQLGKNVAFAVAPAASAALSEYQTPIANTAEAKLSRLTQIPGQIVEDVMTPANIVPAMKSETAGAIAPFVDPTGAFNVVKQLAGEDKANEIARTVEHSTAGLLNFFTTPAGLATLGLGSAPAVLQNLTKTAFAGQAVKAAPDLVAQFNEAKTFGEKADAVSNILLHLGMAGAGVEAGAARPVAGVRPAGLPQQTIDRAITENQLQALAPEPSVAAREVQPMPSDVMDGLHLTREVRVKELQKATTAEERAKAQAEIDDIDNQLLEADRNEVAASRERVASRGQSQPPESAPVPPDTTTGVPPAEGGTSGLFTQARREAGVEPPPVPAEPIVKVEEVTKDPAQMTMEEHGRYVAERDKVPEQYVEGYKDGLPIISKDAPLEYRKTTSGPRTTIQNAFEDGKPVSAQLFEETNKASDHPLKLPEGYVRDGDLLVKKGEAIPSKDQQRVDAYARVDEMKQRIASDTKDDILADTFETTAKNAIDKAIESGKPINWKNVEKWGTSAGMKERAKAPTSIEESVGETTVGESIAEPPPLPKNTELYAPLKEVMATLPERDARIVQQVVGEGRSLREVADENGLSHTAVAGIVEKSTAALRKRLAEKGFSSEDYEGGGGPMGPIERAEKEALEVTGTKNVKMREEREARGLEDIVQEEPVSNRTSIDEARSKLETNPNLADEIVEGLNNSTRDVRTISAADEAVLMARKVDLMKERAVNEAILADGNKTPEEHVIANRNLEEIEAKMNAVDQATYASGVEWGRMGQLRQRLLRADFSFEAMERRARIAKGDALTPQERARIDEQSREISSLEKQLAELQKKNDTLAREKASEESFSDIKKQAEASTSPETKIAPRVIALAESIASRLDKAADAARARIRERLGKTSAGVDPTVIYDVAVIGLSKLARASLDFAKWSVEMKSDLGDWVEPHLKEAWDKTEELWKAEEAKVSKADRPAVSRVRQKNLDEAQKQQRLYSVISNHAKEGVELDSLRNPIQKLALSFVRQDLAITREALIDKLHGIVKGSFPDITREQTRDLLSGYGDFKALDKEKAKVILRGYKGEAQQQAKIDALRKAIAEGSRENPLKKTGGERRTKTDEERRYEKEVNELKKQGKFVTTDPETQLKTTMDGIKTRLRNEIVDLDTAMATHERIPGKKSSVEYDAEAQALKEQRDAKKAQYDEMFPKEPLTREQQISQASKALDRSIAQLESDIKAGKLYGTKGPKLTSPELEAKRARLDALRSEREMLRDLDTASVEAKKEAELLKAIDRARNALPEPKEGTPTVDTERVAQLKQTLQEARDARKSSPETMRAKIEQATESVRKRIDVLNERIIKGEFDQKKEYEPLRSNELDALRSERDALAAYIREQREAMKPKKSADELALQAYKTRTANRIAELQERTAKGDFAPRPKKEGPKLDKEGMGLKFQLEEAKEKFHEGLVKYQRENRNLIQRVAGGIVDASNLQRAIYTGLDLSAVFNQGGFVTMGAWRHPVTTFKALRAMVQAMRSKEGRFGIDEGIRNRERAELYDKAKLYRSGAAKGSLHAAEEQFMSRWLDKIELSATDGLKGAALRSAQRLVNAALSPVRASERAYTGFLNQLRVETFDRMVNAFESEKGPLSLEDARSIAHYVNSATGRGGFGKFERAGAAFSTLFFSPRFAISRLGLLLGEPIVTATPRTRALISREYGKYLSGVAAFYALGIGAGGTVEVDPRSSDFGKLKIGNTRLDPLVGMSQWITFLARTITGETKTGKGQIVPLRAEERPLNYLRDAGILHDQPAMFQSGNPRQQKWLGTAGKFVRSKLAPAPGAFASGLGGEDYQGKPTTIKRELAKIVYPMTPNDIVESAKKNGVAEAAAWGILQMLGFRVNTYEDKINR